MAEPAGNPPPPIWQALPPELRHCARLLERTLSAVDALHEERLAIRHLLQEARARFERAQLTDDERPFFHATLNELVDRLRADGDPDWGRVLFNWLKAERRKEEAEENRRAVGRLKREERRWTRLQGPTITVNLAVLRWHLGCIEDGTQLLADAIEEAADDLKWLRHDVKRARRLLRRVVANTPERDNP